MRIAYLVVSMIVLALTPLAAPSEARDLLEMEDKRSIDIPYTFEPPVLDGNIGSLEWESEFAIHYFDAFDGESFSEVYPASGSDEEFVDQSDLAVTFYMLYDDQYLYFAANVTDEEIVIDSGSTYWRDDGVELLVDGAHDQDEDQRAGDPWPGYQDGTTLLAVADGSVFHDYSSGSPYERSFGAEGDWFSATSMHHSENYYIVEMRLRLDSIDSPLPNSTIGLNIGVNDDDTGGDSKTALKWEGKETLPGENPTFKNETLWGEARLVPYVNASLPERLDVDEDVEVEISSNSSAGNHPDFDTDAVYQWLLPVYFDGEWQNISFTGPIFTYTFREPSIVYNLRLTVKGPSGGTDDTVTYVHVADLTPPSVDPEDGEAMEEEPFTYRLNASDNVGISNVSWSLLDGEWYNTTTNGTAFRYQFQHPGQYELFYVVFDISGNFAGGSVTISVLDNRPPHVPEIFDIEMNTTHPRTVSAAGSYDDTPEGRDPTSLSFNWTISGEVRSYSYFGETVDLDIEVPGLYNGTLVVTDASGFSTFKEFLVIVSDTTPPTPEILLPDVVDEGRNISLVPWATSDNDPHLWDGAAVIWTVELSSGSFFHTTDEWELNISFPGPGTAAVTLEVTDPAGNVGTKTVKLEVLDATPPVLVLNIPPSVPEGDPFLLDLSGSSDNSGILSIHYEVHRNLSGELIPVMETPPFGVRVRNVAPADYVHIEDLSITLEDPGEYVISIRLMDLYNLSCNEQVNLIVLDATPPLAVLNRTYAPVLTGELLLLSARESSDEVGPLTFKWLLDGELLDAQGPEFGYVFTTPGTHNITLLVSDAQGNNDTSVCLVKVVEPLPEEEGSANHTLLLIWTITISLMILGTLFIFLWARSKRRAYMEEE